MRDAFSLRTGEARAAANLSRQNVPSQFSPNMSVSTKEIIYAAGASVLVAAVTWSGALMSGALMGSSVGLAAGLGTATGLILFAVFHALRGARWEQRLVIDGLHRGVKRMLDRQFQQTESMLSVMATVQPERPLPRTRSWAASPDLIQETLRHCIDERPTRVLETGSGVSTVFLAYALQDSGGHVIALEQDEDYAAETRDMLRFHGLEDVATVVHAPLHTYDIDGESWLWYNWSPEPDDAFDFLFIDGPSGDVQDLARYPVLPLVGSHVRDGSAVFVDDAARDDERQTVERWTDEEPVVVERYVDLEKGLYVLRYRRPEADGDREVQ